MNKKKTALIVAGALVAALAIPATAFAANTYGFGAKPAAVQSDQEESNARAAEQSVSEAVQPAVDTSSETVVANVEPVETPSQDARPETCPGFVDADGDGICDIYGEGCQQGSGFVDSDGDGTCDNFGTGAGQGQGFVDADNDNVCDNFGTGAGQGQGGGYGQGNGNGQGFTDANGDGSCDNRGEGAGRGNGGAGRGNGMHRAA